MAADDPSGARPGPVVLRIKLRYDDVDAMVQRFAPNVGRSGLFLPTRSLQPIGTEVKFELRLSNDTPVLVGVGRVKSVKAPDPANPRAAFGMAIELMRVTREAREVIIRMIERRRALGLPELGIPMPEDVEAARRADMDSHPRADTAGVVRDALQGMASAPVAEQVITGPRALSTGPVLLVPQDPARPITGPVATAPPEPAAEPARPRSLTGPLPAARHDSGRPVPAGLPPEPPRARRPRVADLIAKAAETSGAVAAAVSVEGLDEQVDVERALVRARTLAGGDLDAELAALRESAAAPIEITIEAASAELARQLGGAPIAPRDRKARWAPPPAVATEPDAQAGGSGAAAPSGAAGASNAEASNAGASNAGPSDTRPSDSGPSDARPSDDRAASDARPSDSGPSDARPSDDRAASDVAAEPRAQRAETEGFRYDSRRDDPGDVHSAATGEPEPPADRIAHASEPTADAHRSFTPGNAEIVTEPSAHADDAHAADAPIEPAAAAPQPSARKPALFDEDPELDAFDRALDAAIIHTGQTRKAPEPAEPLDDDDAELLDSDDLEPADDDGRERTVIGAYNVDPSAFLHHGQPTVPDSVDALGHAGAAEDAGSSAAELAAGEPATGEPGAEDEEIIDDVDVLAEADADDADLLSADGERDASGSSEQAPAPPGPYEESYDRARGYDAHAGYDARSGYGGHAGYDSNAGAYDRNAAAYDPNAAAYDPNAAAYDPNAGAYDPNAAAYDPNAAAYDPNAAAYDPNAAAYDRNAAAYPSAAAYDPDAAGYDPNAAGYEPNAAGYDPSAGAAQPYDPNAGAYAPNAGGAQPYDPNAAGYDPNAAAYSYDAHGNPVTYDAHGNPVTYDAHGNPVTYDAHGNPVTHDAHGNPVTYDAHGNPVTHDAHGNTYDAHGNVVSYDEHGNAISYDEHGNAITYDAHGNVVSYDAHGNPVTYDAHGNPVTYDAHGNPISYDAHGNPVAYDAHGYDANGNARAPHDSAHAYDANAAAYDANAAAYDAHAPAYDANAPAYDAHAPAYDANAAAYDANAPAFDANRDRYARAPYAEPARDPDPYAAAPRGYDANAYAAAHAPHAPRARAAHASPEADAPGTFDPDEFASEYEQGEYRARSEYPPQPPAAFEAPRPNTGSFDFASRLDLDDSGLVERPSPPRYPGYDEQLDRASSYDPPSSSYTFAESFPISRDSGVDFDEPHGFVSDPAAQARRARRASSEPAPAPAPRSGRRPPTDYDLESALEQLDPDVDVSGAHDPLAPPRSSSSSPRLPGLPPSREPVRPPRAPSSATQPPPTRSGPVRTANTIKRTPAPEVGKPARPTRAASEDDGILIDFDDED